MTTPQTRAKRRAAQRREQALVPDRPSGVAALAPVDDEDGVTILPPARSFTTVRDKRYGATRRRLNSLRALLAERGLR